MEPPDPPPLQDAVPAPADALSAIGPGDTAGTETLARYVYQCKVAVQRWLQTLAQPAETQIVCEFVDDITTVTDVEIVFAQVKTRDRGAWTAAKVSADGGGLDSLVRSYNLAKGAGCVDFVRLELILEGPEGGSVDTREFFANPSCAVAAQRTKLLALGLDAADVDDFLARLRVTTQYHARQSIDGVTLQMLMSIAPEHSAQIAATYKELLDCAISAHLGLAAHGDQSSPLVLQPRDQADTPEPLSEHALTREKLLELLPFVPALADEQRRLLDAANGGALAITDLEFKLRVAGANDATVERAKSKRAKASATLARRPGLVDETDQALQQLGDRVLEHADGVVADVTMTAGSPAAAYRPAEAIYGRLIQQVPQLGALDIDGIFAGNGEQVLGLLCEISDQCRFAWRST